LNGAACGHSHLLLLSGSTERRLGDEETSHLHRIDALGRNVLLFGTGLAVLIATRSGAKERQCKKI
jgi:hypothetical protein